MGYRLCAFLDADTPLEIFRRLLVGSEGTLAFVAEAVFDTVPLRPRTRRPPGSTSPTSTSRGRARSRRSWRPGATRGRADGRAGADGRARYSIPGTPEYWTRAPAESAALLVEFARRRRGRARRPGGRAPARSSPATSSIRAADFTRDPELIEIVLARARGPARAASGAAAAGHRADHRGRVRAAGADRRVGRATSRRCSASTGSSPASRATRRRATCTSCSPPTSPSPRTAIATRRSWTSLVELIVDKYDGSLKAEHGTGHQHGAVRRARVGPQGDRADVADQAARRPRRGARAGRAAQPRPRGAPAQPEDDSRRSRRSPTPASSAASASRCARAAMLTTTPRQRIVLRREMARQPQGSPVLRRR